MHQNSSSKKSARAGAPASTPAECALQRNRLPFAASTRKAQIVGKFAGAGILLLGGIFAALVSGFGMSTPHLSLITVTGALLAAILSSWIGAVVLRTASRAALLFSAPMAAGLVFAVISRQWWACATLLVCMFIPFAALTLYRFDQRKPDRTGV
jgi:hypothetical protein